MPLGLPGGGASGSAEGVRATARVEQIACDDIAAVGTATHINPQAGGSAVSVVYGDGDAELVTAVTDAANNGLVTLAAGLHLIEVTGAFQGSAASVGAEVRCKRWRDGSDEANDPVLAVETVSLPLSATDHRDSVPLIVWLAAPTRVYFEMEELGSTATVAVDDPKINVVRWGGGRGLPGPKGDTGDPGDDAADFTRAESFDFEAPGTINSGSNETLGIAAAETVDVDFGSGDAEMLTLDAANDRVTVKAGLYTVEIAGELNAINDDGGALFQFKKAADDTDFDDAFAVQASGTSWEGFARSKVFVVGEDETLYVDLAVVQRNINWRNIKVRFARWGGGEASGGAAFRIHDIADELVDYVAAGGPTGALGASDLAAVSDESATDDPNKKITAENLGRELLRILANHTTPVSHLALTDRVPFADQNFNWRGGVVAASQFRDMVFENPSSGLSDAQKAALRTAMDAAVAFEIALVPPGVIADADQIAFADDDDDSNKRESALDFANFVLGKRPKAANTDIDAIASTGTAISTSLADPSALDDTDYLSVRKFVRGLARVVKTASTTIRGVVLLARAEDLAATETDTSRVPTIAGVKTLIARLASGGGSAIAASDEGTALTAALASMNFVGAGVTATDDGSGNVTVTIPGGGAPAPGSHDRYIGWAAAAAPTNDELDGLTRDSDDVLPIPGTNTDGYIVIGQEASAADLTSIVFSNGGSQNWLTSFTKIATTRTLNGETVEFWVSNNALSAAVYGTGSVTATIAR